MKYSLEMMIYAIGSHPLYELCVDMNEWNKEKHLCIYNEYSEVIGKVRWNKKEVEFFNKDDEDRLIKWLINKLDFNVEDVI